MSHLLEIPDALYTALKEAADARGLSPLAGLPPTSPPLLKQHRAKTQSKRRALKR